MLRRVATRSGVVRVATTETAAPAAAALPLVSSKRHYAERTYGGLKDSDRIFTNLYGEHDIFLKGALQRVQPSLVFFNPPAKL